MAIITENNRDSHIWNEMSAMLSEKDFRRLSELIHGECGIKMPDPKKIMIEARLRKRLRELGMKSFDDVLQVSVQSLDMEHICVASGGDL